MKEKIIIGIALIFSVLILVLSDFGQNRTVIYDCRDAHWHPDIPIEVKRECSRLMYEEWKREYDERKNDPSLHENRRDLLRT